MAVRNIMRVVIPKDRRLPADTRQDTLSAAAESREKMGFYKTLRQNQILFLQKPVDHQLVARTHLAQRNQLPPVSRIMIQYPVVPADLFTQLLFLFL